MTPTEPEEDAVTELRQSSIILGAIFVDGIIQALLTWWATWIFKEWGVDSFNPYVWWFGSLVMYVTAYQCHKEAAGHMLIWHIIIQLVFTLVGVTFL